MSWCTASERESFPVLSLQSPFATSRIKPRLVQNISLTSVSIGSFYAFILSRAPGVRLSVLARSNYGPVKENGIIMNSHNHGDHVVRPYKGQSTSWHTRRNYLI